jgi:hypothetical protein
MSDDASLYHPSGIVLRRGSIIEPGNFGRIILATGPHHTQWIREHALEEARVKNHADKPARFAAAFTFVDEKEARSFRARIPGFQFHILYRVSLLEPDAPSHLTDTRLCDRQSSMDYDWADLYWHTYDPTKIFIPGKGSLADATGGITCRELITLSPLKIVAVSQ